MRGFSTGYGIYSNQGLTRMGDSSTVYIVQLPLRLSFFRHSAIGVGGGGLGGAAAPPIKYFYENLGNVLSIILAPTERN